MSIKDIMRTEIKMIPMDANLREAARMMHKHHVGTLIVVDKKKEGRGKIPVGIITDRDIALSLRKKSVETDELIVSDLMTKNVIICSQNDDPLSIMRKMMQNGIRRIPVVNSKDQIVGIVSSDDFVQLLAEELLDLSQVINAEIDKEGNIPKKTKENEQLKLRAQLAS